MVILLLLLCPSELMSDGTVAEVEDDGVCSAFDDVDDDASAGGRSGEWELAEVLVDANGTPVEGYKS